MLVLFSLEEKQYPIGKFDCPDHIDDDQVRSWIYDLENLPKNLRKLVEGLNDQQLDTPYREMGWTLRQVVHHLADSHHHSYVRFKWALTEKKPIIKFYYEKEWAELFDAKSGPIELSLRHLEVVHSKLVYLLKGLSNEDLDRTFIHPENNEEISLRENIGKYAWHGKHHYAHIEQLLISKAWN